MGGPEWREKRARRVAPPRHRKTLESRCSTFVIHIAAVSLLHEDPHVIRAKRASGRTLRPDSESVPSCRERTTRRRPSSRNSSARPVRERPHPEPDPAVRGTKSVSRMTADRTGRRLRGLPMPRYPMPRCSKSACAFAYATRVGMERRAQHDDHGGDCEPFL